MELVLKLPEGKLPFIGVRFDTAYDAHYQNQDLTQYTYYTLQIRLKKSLHHSGRPNDHVKLTFYAELELRSHDEKKFKFYTVNMNPEEFDDWRRKTKGFTNYNFGQVYNVDGEDKIAYVPNAKPFVLKVCALFVIG